MNADHGKELSERWLDQALARYSDAEPRTGMEERILANLAAHKLNGVPQSRRLFRVLAGCAAGVVLLAGVAALWHAKRPSADQPAMVVTTPPTVRREAVAGTITKSPVLATAIRTRDRSPKKARAKTKAFRPQQERFPAPAPLSDQQRLLLAYLSATPTDELLAVAADQRAWRARVQERVEPGRQDPAPDSETDQLQASPPEGGSVEEGASAPDRETP